MNALKTGLLLIALTSLLLFAGMAMAGDRGLSIGLMIAVLMNGAAYFFSDKIALASSRARPVTREQAPRLYSVVQRLCATANLPLPRLYVMPQPAPNAFATGRNPRHASVAVTAGLLELLSDEELEGVIAHELAHVRNFDILTASVAATLAGGIIWIANLGQWALFFGGGSRNGGSRGSGLGTVLMIILAPLAAVLIQLGISRRREFAADAAAARMVGHPFGLISALNKLGAYNKCIPMEVAPATSSLFIVAPLSAGEVFRELFSTHPPLEARIAALRGMVVAR